MLAAAGGASAGLASGVVVAVAESEVVDVVDVVESSVNGMVVDTSEETLDTSGNASGLSLEGEEPTAAGASVGAEPEVVTSPLGPEAMTVSEVPTLESLVDCAAAGKIVDPVSTTMTVLVMDTVRTVPEDGSTESGGRTVANDPPVPVAPLLGKTPFEGSTNGSGEVCRFEDEDEASCGIVSKGDLALVVRGSLLLLTIWRFTCRGK